jgi:recombinational DNA repair protein RecT
MKCKDCNYDCARRGEGETECFYELEMKRQKEAEEAPYWRKFRAEAAKDILCSMINHFGTSNIDMNDVVKWTDSLISKLKEKEVRNERYYS